MYLTYFFQQVIVDMTTNGVALEVEIDVHVFTKSRGIIVSVCFRISKWFQNDVGFQ